MLSVEEARATVVSGVRPLPAETIRLDNIFGRVSAEAIRAKTSQPPFDASAMDGFAVRFDDLDVCSQFRVIGEARAGFPYSRAIERGEALRIFTGAPLPDGADHVVIQEDVVQFGRSITIHEKQGQPGNIRRAGIDFFADDLMIEKGTEFHTLHGAILAAANISSVRVFRRPRVAIFANGDELIEPGETLAPGKIVNSNHYAISEMVRFWGGDPTYLGCAPDRLDAVSEFFERAKNFDVIVPIGGASVGDYDFVKRAFAEAQGEIEFEKVAVKPGKPTWFGHMGPCRVLGLPGNPASAIVTAGLFLQPLIRKLAGKIDRPDVFAVATITTNLAENGPRETFLRAVAEQDPIKRVLEVTPAANQDSSRLSPFLTANVLVRRKKNAPALQKGEGVEVIFLN